MAKKNSEPNKEEQIDDLANLMASNLNKKFKDTNYKVAYFLEEIRTLLLK